MEKETRAQENLAKLMSGDSSALGSGSNIDRARALFSIGDYSGAIKALFPDYDPEVKEFKVGNRTVYKQSFDGGRTWQDMPGVGDYLQTELSRAIIAPDGTLGRDVVAMHSELEYRDDLSSVTRRVTLVYPGEQDVAAWKISVLTPIGAALIGLSAGQSIAFHDRTGEERRLTVTQVF